MTPDMKIAPLRSLNDFLLESARFQLPNVQDLEKWGNRVTNNLLYYQSNYFLLSLIIYLLVGLLHPGEMFTGMLAMGVAFGLFHYFTSAKPNAERFKKEHPVLSLVFVLTGGGFIVYMFGSILVLLFGVLLPVAVTFIHASFRLRNVKNKVVNKLEVLETKKTPMWLILELLDVVGEAVVTGPYLNIDVMDLLGLDNEKKKKR